MHNRQQWHRRILRLRIILCGVIGLMPLVACGTSPSTGNSDSAIDEAVKATIETQQREAKIAEAVQATQSALQRATPTVQDTALPSLPPADVRPSSSSNPNNAVRSTEKLEVTQQRTVQFGGVDTLIWGLSPNGKWLVVLRDRDQSLCIYEAESLTENFCTQTQTGPISEESIAWSPNSKFITFTEDGVKQSIDSDVWILDVEISELRNLTDDGVNCDLLKAECPRTQVDIAPAWSPDNNTLVFFRWSGDAFAIHNVSARNKASQKLLTVELSGVVMDYGLRWSSDGKSLLYTIDDGRDNPNNGLWIVGQDGQNPKQLVEVTDQEKGAPYVIDVATTGNKALVLYRN